MSGHRSMIYLLINWILGDNSISITLLAGRDTQGLAKVNTLSLSVLGRPPGFTAVLCRPGHRPWAA